MISASPLKRRPGFRVLTVLIAAMSAVAIAACGSSSGHKAHRSSNRGSFLAFSKCMRSNGITDFPDPSGAGGIQLPPSINPFSPSFRAAQSKCNKLMPGGGPGNHPASEQQKLQLFAAAACMRRHGVTGFPDPTSTPPTTQQGYSLIEGLGSNLFLEVPSTIDPVSPAFKHAARVCHFG